MISKVSINSIIFRQLVWLDIFRGNILWEAFLIVKGLLYWITILSLLGAAYVLDFGLLFDYCFLLNMCLLYLSVLSLCEYIELGSSNKIYRINKNNLCPPHLFLFFSYFLWVHYYVFDQIHLIQQILIYLSLHLNVAPLKKINTN